MRALNSFSMSIALFAALAFAQESAPEPAAEPAAAPVLEPQAAPEPPPEPAAPEQPAAQVQEPAPEASAQAEAVQEQPAAQETPAAEQVAQEPAAQEESAAQETVAQEEPAVAEPAAAEQVAQEPAAPAQEEPQIAAPVATVQEQAPAPEPQKMVVQAEQAQALIKDFHLGIRAGLGISALRGHKAVGVESEEFGKKGIKLVPAASAAVGLVFAIEINDLLTVVPELNYTLYRASGQFVARSGKLFSERDLQIAEAELQSIELPILVRFNIGPAYAEVGPQMGINLESRIYQNNYIKSPEPKRFAFGPSIGGGVNVNGILLGLRGHFGLLEYAKNTKGYPWAVHASATRFFF